MADCIIFMNIPDLILVIAALFSIWLAVLKGFIHATADLLIWVGSVVIAFFGYPYVASIFGRIAQASPWLLPVSFLSILLISGLLLSWLSRRLLRDLPPSVWKSRINHAFGVLPGIVNAFITTCVLALLFVSVPFSDSFSDQAEASKAVAFLTPPAEWAQEKLTPVFNEAIKRSMTKMTVEPESDEMVTLPFRDSTVKERPDLEARMLEMVNEERVSRGLKALAADTAMRRVAIAHSRDMFARGYFAHETPEKKS
ncbi:MAG: CvpA family protein, partial [Chitinophagaceae bacterium]|nr:CvpA family protein [Chitinophagaceae bacterium]